MSFLVLAVSLFFVQPKYMNILGVVGDALCHLLDVLPKTSTAVGHAASVGGGGKYRNALPEGLPDRDVLGHHVRFRLQ